MTVLGYAVFSFVVKYLPLLSAASAPSSVIVYPQLIIGSLLLYAFFLKYDRAKLATATLDCLLFFIFIFTLVSILFPSFAPVLSLIFRFLVYSPWITIPIYSFTNLSFFDDHSAAAPVDLSFNITCLASFLLFLANYYSDSISFHPYSHLNNFMNGYLPSPLTPIVHLILHHNNL